MLQESLRGPDGLPGEMCSVSRPTNLVQEPPCGRPPPTVPILILCCPTGRNHADDCCGNWTADGEFYIFQSNRNGRTDLWAIREKRRWWSHSSSEPFQLTAGPLSFSLPLPSNDGKKVFALGTRLRGELLRLDLKSGEFVPYFNGMSATGIAFSRDGAWISWAAFPERTLGEAKRMEVRSCSYLSTHGSDRAALVAR
jgi:hypothetical protein